MKTYGNIAILIIAALGATAPMASAQSINLWRGNEAGADWNDVYKWKLKHTPRGTEAVHFRQQSSAISVNSTIELGNGMHLYGQELLLEGNGNINLRSPVPHQRTITIPASSSGYANLTLTDNLSINGQISLAAKAFGTSASKGSVTLKNRSTITGELTIGNDGGGSGQIILRDQSTYRITHLEIDTLASKGGSAEIHILGGTARLAIGDNPFDVFLADASRKIVIGDNGTLHIESDMPVEFKKQQLEKMIEQKRIVSDHGCEFAPIVIRDKMILVKAERTYAPAQPAALLAATSKKPTQPVPPTTPPPVIAKTQPQKPAPEEQAVASTKKTPATPASGYIIFLSPALLLLLRKAQPKAAAAAVQTDDAEEENSKGRVIVFPTKAA